MSIDHPKKQTEVILLDQWGKKWFSSTKDITGANDTAAYVSATAAVPSTDFTVTLISETKG